MRENYLTEHTVGSIITGSFHIYFRNFPTLFLIYAAPVVPVALLQAEAQNARNTPLVLGSVLLTMLVSFFATAAVTIAVSDICLGNAPTVRRSYARIFGKLVGLLLLTNLLQVLALVTGLILLVIPGLILIFWLILSPQIVMLEGRSGLAALKRSKQLADGSHWRNAGVLFVLMIVMCVFGALIGGLFSALFPHLLENWVSRALIVAVQQGVATPIALTSLVLIYYDRRVRKEGYDARGLAEDLAR